MPLTSFGRSMPLASNGDDEIRFAQAILKGTTAGIQGLVEMAIHPLDNILYPVSMLVFDAAVLAVKHGVYEQDPLDPVSHQLPTYIKEHPWMYEESLFRMKSRIEGLEAAGVHFMVSEGDERTALVAEYLTNVLVPGFIFKGLKTIAITARNIERFGLPVEPPKFQNLKLEIVAPPPFETLTAQRVKTMPGSTELLYVITEDRELLFCLPKLETPIPRVIFTSQCTTKMLDKIFHSELARFKQVYAAGEVEFFEGTLMYVNPASGHYLPMGPHLPTVVKHIFEKNGILDPLGRFRSFDSLQKYSHRKPIITKAPSTIRLTPGVDVFATAAVQLGARKGQRLEDLVAEAFSQHTRAFENKFEQTYEAFVLQDQQPTAKSTHFVPNIPKHGVPQATAFSMPEERIEAHETFPLIDAPASFNKLTNTLLENKQQEASYTSKIDSIVRSATNETKLLSLLQSPPQWRSPVNAGYVQNEGHRFFSDRFSVQRAPNICTPSVTPHMQQAGASFFSKHQSEANKLGTQFQSFTVSLLHAAKEPRRS